MTLDGYFEGASPWSLDFHTVVWGEELEAYSLEQLDEVGTLLFGRRTFNGMAEHWSNETGAIADRMNAVEKFVATREGRAAEWSNSRILHGDISEHVAELKAADDKKDIFVFGSADLTATLLKREAVDEIRLCLVPIVLGGGNPLFRDDGIRKGFRLLEARPFKSGGVLLRYARSET
ncbi:dihydrofolate reductase family protein [Labrenzia sp. THAF35]|uniref:dihydrofolate reductase family protein n=1 Tax=Labrenzia sp. THAF35 TaxID=2587854 RepID=UPI0025702117|nr:dihydrofolate reductase family protein [Labrenzia sp. THAF35]